MKIIFLDVDGVLNHSQSLGWEGGNWKVLDQECLGQLLRILDHTGAKLVLSSMWRFSEEGRQAIATHFGSSIIGKTPRVRMFHGPRKEEILAWLESSWPYTYGWNGERITQMAVLDDDSDADLNDGSFFKTDFEAGGLTEAIADRVIEHLLKPSVLL